MVLSVRMKANVFALNLTGHFILIGKCFSYFVQNGEGRWGIFIFPPFRLSGMVSHVKGVAGDTSTDNKCILRLFKMPEC